jgi:murein DD-endopeptidase MepM/ murein hydrolase activator NlpD
MFTRAIRLAMVAAALILWAGTASQAQTSRDVYFDLPVGACSQGKLVLGHRYYVQRDFETLNRQISNRCKDRDGNGTPDDYFCFHAGVDLTLLGNHAGAVFEPVYAAADGRVVFSDMTSEQGRTIVLEHLLPDGTTLYTAYLHLNRTALAAVGEPVRRGQPLGTILSWPDDPGNSHVHFEIRPTADGQVTIRNSDGTLGANYFGNGYSLLPSTNQPGEAAPASVLGEWGFSDPMDFFFDGAHRPPYPAWVLTQENLGAEPYTCSTRRQLRSSPTEDSGNVLGEIDAASWFRSQGLEGETDGRTSDEDEFLRGWYRRFNANRTEYILGFQDQSEPGNGIGGPLCVGEPFRVGRLWQPPTQNPVIDLRFATEDWNGTDLKNWAAETVRVAVTGNLSVVAPYEYPGVSAEVQEIMEARLCDRAGLLLRDTALEVALDPETGFQAGVAFEARIHLDAVDGTRFLAGRWEEEGEQWKLEVIDGSLVFTVRQAGGLGDLSVRAPLPAPRCKTDGSCNVDCTQALTARRDCLLDAGYRQWAHVGAVADAFERNAVELFWAGARVARTQLVTTLAESTAPVRIGDSASGITGKIDDVAVWEIDPRNRPLDLAFAIDTTGSMSDDLAAVKSAATQIIDALEDASADYRVAVTDFRDFPFSPYGVRGIDYPYRVETPFSGDRQTIVGGINALRIGSGADLPESVYSGVLGPILGRPDSNSRRVGGWRSDAQKIVILMGDAPPHDPEPVTGFDISDVIEAAISGGFEIGDPIPNTPGSGAGPLRQAAAAETARIPVRIFSVLIGGNTQARSFFRQMAEGTDGELFAAATANQVVPAILSAIGSINQGGGGLPPVNQAPEVAFAYASREQLWPPNHQMQRVTIEGVVDLEGDPVTVTITGITQDEPVTDKGSQRSPDGEGVGTSEARLRAERSPGSHDGRVYQITFTATDDRGNSSTGRLRVCVPHDPSPNTVCIDDGQAYNSTQP